MRDHSSFITMQELRDKILTHKTNALSLERWSKILQLEAPQSVANQNHKAFMAESTDLDKGMKQMINGLELYCNGFRGRFNSAIGKDAVLGNGVAAVIEALFVLLQGPGNWDVGTVDANLRYIAKLNVVESIKQ